MPKSLKDEWERVYDMDVHTQAFLRLLSNFELSNLMDLVEMKVGNYKVQTMRHKLRALLKSLTENVIKYETEVDDRRLESVLDYEGSHGLFKAYGQKLRQSIIFNFCY